MSTVIRPVLWFGLCSLLASVLAAQCSNPTQVANQTDSSGPPITDYDPNALLASGVVINGSASVAFIAGHCIQLMPGFHATKGTSATTFHAFVDTTSSVSYFTPSAGSGLSALFTIAASSPSGYSNLSDLYAIFNTTVSGMDACYIRYNRGSNLLYLADNSGTMWNGGFVPGSSGTVSNSYCTISGNGSSVSGSGTQLFVNVNVSFNLSTFSGTRMEYLSAWDKAGLFTGWNAMGTWTVANSQQYSLTTNVSRPGAGSVNPSCPGGARLIRAHRSHFYSP